MKKKFTSLLVLLSMDIHWVYTQAPPNLVVFIVVDVSWNDFGCYGNPVVQTPNIDDLASNGLMFTNFYLTASSCSPNRNSIMTGRYPNNTYPHHTQK